MPRDVHHSGPEGWRYTFSQPRNFQAMSSPRADLDCHPSTDSTRCDKTSIFSSEQINPVSKRYTSVGKSEEKGKGRIRRGKSQVISFASMMIMFFYSKIVRGKKPKVFSPLWGLTNKTSTSCPPAARTLEFLWSHLSKKVYWYITEVWKRIRWN